MRKPFCTAMAAALWLAVGVAAQPTTFLIEAEDFDFDGGQHRPEVNSMPYYGGAYEGLAAIHAVDYFRTTDEFWADLYRYGEQPNAPMFYSLNPEAMDRGEWSSTYNFRLGFMNPQNWYNYTRVFPAGNYRIYAALLDGSSVITPDRIRAMLGIVTAGTGTAQQTVQDIGEFVGTGTGRWDVPTQVMLASSGTPVVIPLSGQTTIRFTGEFGDFDYLLFVPENAPGPTILADKTELNAGERLLLTANVIGEAPFTFQWRFNGTDIPGATSSTFEVPAVGMEHTGNYTVFVSNEHGAMLSSSVRINVTFPISIGDTVSPDMPSAGAGWLSSEQEQDVYTFQGKAGDAIFVEGILGEACSGLDIKVVTPRNENLLSTALGFCTIESEPYMGVILPLTGKYTVVVSTRGYLSDPNYSFRIVDLPAANVRTMALGETIEGTGTDRSTLDAFEFAAPESGAVFVEELAGSGCYTYGANWAIYDPDGMFLKADALGVDCFSPSRITQAVPTVKPGIYTLVVVHGAVAEPYSFRLLQSFVQTHTISLGAHIVPDAQSGAGMIEAVGAVDFYDLTGDAGQSVYFYGKVAPEDVSATFEIKDPRGMFLGFGGGFGGTDFIRNTSLFTLPESGTYRITISSPSGGTGSYSFDLLPSVGTQELSYEIGTTVAAGTGPAGFLDGNGAVDEFTFTVPEGGAILQFVDLGSDGSNLIWSVQQIAQWPTWPLFIEPLDGSSAIEGAIGFYYGGTYRIAVTAKDGDPNISGSYSFKTIIHHPPVAVADTFKTKVGKSIRIPKGRLLSNDSDPDGGVIRIENINFDPFLSNGVVEDFGDTLLFTPTAGFVGEAIFTYNILDEFGLRSQYAPVTIQVQ
jgi:hypothetical protein